MTQDTPIDKRPDIKVSDRLLNHPKFPKLPSSEYRILAGYGSALYPVNAVMGVGTRNNTSASRAAEILQSKTEPVPPQYDFILANGGQTMVTTPFNTSVEYTPNIYIDSNNDREDKQNRIKVATTTLRSLSDELRNWNQGSGLHWRMSKPSLIMASSDAYNASISDVDSWLNKFLIDIDANRYYSILLTLLQLNEGNNFVHQKLELTPTLNLSTILHRLACTSYDGDIRTADALSIESVPAAKWAKALTVHTIPWLATYLPILSKYQKNLGIKLENVDDDAINAILKAASLLEDRRLEKLEEIILKNQKSAIPSDNDMLYDLKDVVESADNILRECSIKKNMEVWMVDERKGMEQPLGVLYEGLPIGIQNQTNRISSRARLWRLYGPHMLAKNEFQSLGGPLPTEPDILQKGIRAMNLRDSFKLAFNGLYNTGIKHSIRYVKEKAARHRLH